MVIRLNHVCELEAKFSALHAAPGAVAAGLGRAALYLALEAIGVRGGQVLVPDFICAQVLQAVREAGAMPVYYPVPLDLAVQPEALVAAMTSQTRAAILVHYFGAPQSHIRELVAACRKRALPVIEDCSLALLAKGPAGLCGTLGDYAAFSFTKNNWCYGGGMVMPRDEGALARLYALRESSFVSDDAFCLAYGRLCQFDFDSNRPSLARAAASAGARLQSELARSEPRFGRANFFDAGPCNVRMSDQAAERALVILDTEPSHASRRQTLHTNLLEGLGASRRAQGNWVETAQAQILAPAHHNGSFLVALFPSGSSEARIARAAEQEITLRPVWPDYQAGVPQTCHAGRMVTIEVHPELSVEECAQICRFLREG